MMGARRKYLSGLSRRSTGPPSSATIFAKRSAALPSSKLRINTCLASASFLAMPAVTNNCADNAKVTSCNRCGRDLPLR